MFSIKSKYKLSFLTFILIILFSFSPIIQILASDNDPVLEEYVLQNSWGGESNVLNETTDVAIGPDGRIYVANRGMSRITIITPGFEVFNNFGGFGYLEGQFTAPEAVAIDDSGFLYVIDSSYVLKFTLDGEFIKRWGYFNQPSGIAVDSNGYVYVADTGNHRIRKFTSEGVIETTWGREGNGDSEFNFPQGIAIDTNNDIYVADSQNHRIQKFDSSGNYLTQWGDYGSGNGQFIWPFNVEVGNQGEIFVSDWGNYRVQVFSSDIDFLTKWGIFGSEEIHFRSPRGLAIDQQGNVIVAVAGINQVHKYSPAFEFITRWGVTPATPGKFYWPNDIVVDNSKNIYVADTNNQRIQKFNPYGVLLTEWEINYDGPNLAYPIKIDIDSFGNVYVLDSGYAQVQKFDQDGNKFTNWQIQDGIIGVAEDYPTGIAIYEDKYLYVSGGYNNLIHKFNLEDGAFIQSWGGDGSSYGEFNYPFDVAVDKYGDVYVADKNNYRIQKFNDSGDFIIDWGTPSQFSDMTAIIVDKNDFVYVLDSVERSIQAFSSTGTYISKWNTLSLDMYEHLASPRGLSIDSDGYIYIADTHNHRIVTLAPELPELDPETGLILNGNFEIDDESVTNLSKNFFVIKSLLETNERDVNGLDHWTYVAGGPVARTTESFEGNYSVLLGTPTEDNAQEIGSTWISQVFYIPTDSMPTLTFNYNIFTNDTIDNADFIVEIQDALGLNNKSIVVHDGYRLSTEEESPTVMMELGWKSTSYGLSQFCGRFIRLVISNRNLTKNSQGIWTYVENISVHDNSSSLPLPFKTYLPAILQ